MSRLGYVEDDDTVPVAAHAASEYDDDGPPEEPMGLGRFALWYGSSLATVLLLVWWAMS